LAKRRLAVLKLTIESVKPTMGSLDNDVLMPLEEERQWLVIDLSPVNYFAWTQRTRPCGPAAAPSGSMWTMRPTRPTPSVSRSLRASFRAPALPD
jgi:hypothetical protein